MIPILNLTPQQLRRAADVQEKILELQQELKQILGASALVSAAAPEPTTEGPTKRLISAASRAKMRKAQQERWARARATTTEPIPEPRKKSKLSAQGLANIRAGVAKRMAKSAGKAVVAAERPGRKRSAAWKKALSAAMKASWAARRAGRA